jgi:Site-specific recombinase
MEALLQQHLQDSGNPARLIAVLVTKIRPPKARDADHAALMIQALCHVLGRRPELRTALRDALFELLGTRKPVSLYVESGVLPSTGFFPNCIGGSVINCCRTR